MTESACCAISTVKTVPHAPKAPIVGGYQPGDGVRIIQGQYEDSYGTVINVDPDRGDDYLDIRLQEDHNDYWFSPDQVQRIDMT
jgi:transcription antitermination factor NusG